MQLITLLAYMEAPPTLSSSGDTQSAAFIAQVAPYKHEDPPMVLTATVWGDAATRAAANVRADSHWILLGYFRIEKNQPLEFKVQKFYAVSPPLDPGFNSVSLIGRAGRDPEARYFESGAMVANFTLAVNRRSRDDEPDWFNLEIWGKQAQVAADYVRKGSLLGITGSFKLDRWIDRSSGEERTKPVINVDRLELLGGRREAESGGPVRGGESAQPWNAAPLGGQPEDDGIPF
jgi:single-strand DNA-binding protein